MALDDRLGAFDGSSKLWEQYSERLSHFLRRMGYEKAEVRLWKQISVRSSVESFCPKSGGKTDKELVNRIKMIIN